MRNVLVITQYFWPENFKINDLIFKLKKKYKFTVLTGEPNYPEGKIYTKFKFNKKKFNYFYNAKVHRVFTITRGNSKIKLFLNYINFIFCASFYSLIFFKKKKFDLIFVCGYSPIFSIIPAIILKKIYKIPVVLWVLDLWPDTLKAMGVIKSNLIINLLHFFINKIYKNCELILVQSNAMLKKISQRVKKKKIIFFPTWAEDVFKKKILRNKYKKSKGYLNIVFAGNIGEAQDIELIFKCAIDLIKKNKKIKWIFVGEGRKYLWLRNNIKKHKVEKYFVLLGKKPLNEMPMVYKIADIFLVSLKKKKVFEDTVPGKVQSYMMYGKPLLGLVSGETRKLILKSKSGLVANSGSQKDFKKVLTKFLNLNNFSLNKMGDNAKRFALKNFDSSISMNKIEKYFNSIIKESNEK